MLNNLIVFVIVGLMLDHSSVAARGRAQTSPRRSTATAERQQPPLTFRMIMSGKGEENGIITSHHLYAATDGTRVSRAGEVYPSSIRASERMERELKEALRIIERSPLLRKKRQVGERAVAEFVPGDKQERRFAILRTYNHVFVRIESSTLEYVLAFEQFEKQR